MKFTFSSTLKHKAVLKIVISLWNEKAIYNIVSTCFTSGQSVWQHQVKQDIARKISENVNKLPIPSTFKGQITRLIRPIGDEIHSWWVQHNALTLQNNHLKRPIHFIWTPQGTIDKQKTAIILVRNEDIDIVHRYYWACFYCLEDEIAILWNKIDKSDSYNLAKELSYHVTIAYWTLEMDKNLAWLTSEKPTSLNFKTLFEQCSSNLFVFEKLCYRNGKCHGRQLSPGGVKLIVEDHCCSEAAEFFWHKLSLQEKRRFSAGVSVNRCPFDDMVYFIFSHLDEENQMRVLRRCHTKILTCFIDWPRHEFLIEVTKISTNFFKGPTLIALFDLFAYKIGCGNDCYAEVFEEIWELCSKSCRKSLTNSRIDETFLLHFRNLEDKRPVLVLLNCFIRVNKEGIFHSQGLQCCRYLAVASEWELFKDILEEHLPSIESVLKFKKSYEDYYSSWLSEFPTLHNKHRTSRRTALLKDSLGFTTIIPKSLSITPATRLVFDFVLETMEKKRKYESINLHDANAKRLCVE